jgi:hypothetical protein
MKGGEGRRGVEVREGTTGEKGIILAVEVMDYCVKRVAGKVEIELNDEKLHDKL